MNGPFSLDDVMGFVHQVSFYFVSDSCFLRNMFSYVRPGAMVTTSPHSISVSYYHLIHYHSHHLSLKIFITPSNFHLNTHLIQHTLINQIFNN
jgi:hypothetical protein